MENNSSIICDYINSEEIKISQRYRNNKKVRFTTFGYIVTKSIIEDMMELVDEESKEKIIKMMESKSN